MSSRGLLRSMAIIGGAQVVKIAITIVRAKTVAVLLGPSGTGLLSLLNSLREVSTLGAGLGLTRSGVRDLAAAKGDEATLSRVRRVLLGALMIQGAIAMVLIWLTGEILALWILGSTEHSLEVGLVGVAVFLFLVSGSQMTLLQGLRRIGDLARVTVWSTLFGTIAGLAAVVLLGRDGLIWLILMPQAAAILVALRYTRRLPPPDAVRMTPGDIWRAWLPMVKLGVIFMAGSLIAMGTLLIIRSRVTQELGLDAAGYFAAAWSITMIYVGFLLQAMGADFYPRLAEIIHDRAAAVKLVNDQMQLTLALGGPILLVLIGGAPWIIPLLYSAEFEPAVQILQWQTLGNLIKLAGWPRGLLFAAARQGKVFLYLAVQFNLIFLGLIILGLPVMGLTIVGIAFLISYIAGLFVSEFFARRLHGFRWEPLSLRLFVVHALLATALLVLSLNFPLAGAGASVLLGLVTALVGGHVVLSKIGPHGRLVSRAARVYEIIGWPVKARS